MAFPAGREGKFPSRVDLTSDYCVISVVPVSESTNFRWNIIHNKKSTSFRKMLHKNLTRKTWITEEKLLNNFYKKSVEGNCSGCIARQMSTKIFGATRARASSTVSALKQNGNLPLPKFLKIICNSAALHLFCRIVRAEALDRNLNVFGQFCSVFLRFYCNIIFSVFNISYFLVNFTLLAWL